MRQDSRLAARHHDNTTNKGEHGCLETEFLIEQCLLQHTAFSVFILEVYGFPWCGNIIDSGEFEYKLLFALEPRLRSKQSNFPERSTIESKSLPRTSNCWILMVFLMRIKATIQYCHLLRRWMAVSACRPRRQRTALTGLKDQLSENLHHPAQIMELSLQSCCATLRQPLPKICVCMRWAQCRTSQSE